jgi:hypothetical protein
MQAILETLLLKGVAGIAVDYLSADERHVLDAFFGPRPIADSARFLSCGARSGWLEALNWAFGPPPAKAPNSSAHAFAAPHPEFAHEITCVEAALNGHGETALALRGRCKNYLPGDPVATLFGCKDMTAISNQYWTPLGVMDAYSKLDPSKMLLPLALLIAAALSGSLTAFLAVYPIDANVVYSKETGGRIIRCLLSQMPEKDITEGNLTKIYEQVFPLSALDLTPICRSTDLYYLAWHLKNKWKGKRKVYVPARAAAAA